MNEATGQDAAAQPQSQMVRIHMPSVPPTYTYILLSITIFIYLLQVLSGFLWGYSVKYQLDPLTTLGALIPSLTHEGELWRFITPVFLHGTIEHILFNMYALFAVGAFVERQYGHGRFLLLYFLGGFAGNVFSFVMSKGDIPSIGASTAIFALIGAEAVFFYQNRKLFGAQAQKALSNIGFIIVLNLFLGLAPGIDGWGHVGGLLGGLIFAWFAGTLWQVSGVSPNLSLTDQREFRDVLTGAALVGVVFCLLVVWGFLK